MKNDPWQALYLGGGNAEVVKDMGKKSLLISSRPPGSACFYFSESEDVYAAGRYKWSGLINSRGWRVEAKIRVEHAGTNPQLLKIDDGSLEEGLVFHEDGIELLHGKASIPVDLKKKYRSVAASARWDRLSIYVDGRRVYEGKLTHGSSTPNRPGLAFGDMDWTSGADRKGGSEVFWREVRYSINGPSLFSYGGKSLLIFSVGLTVVYLLIFRFLPKVQRDARKSPIAWVFMVMSAPLMIVAERGVKGLSRRLKDVEFTTLQAIVEVTLLCVIVTAAAEITTRRFASWRYNPSLSDVPKILEFEKPEKGSLVLLGVGDSFTYGRGVDRPEDRYLDRLEQYLNDTGIEAKTLNGGWPGVGTEAELKFFKETGIKLNPDIVILSYYANDVSDNIKYRLATDPWSIKDPAPDILKPLFSHGYYIKDGRLLELRLFESLPYVMRRLNDYIDSYRKDSLWESGKIPRYVYSDWDRYRAMYPIELITFRKGYSHIMERGFDLVLSQIEEMKRICDEHNIKFLLVAIPSDMQAETASLWETAKTVLNLNEEDFDLELPDKKIAGFCRTKGIAFLDLLPEIRRRQSNGKLLYNIGERHFNAEGYAVMADLIKNKLFEKGYLTKKQADRRSEYGGTKQRPM